MKLPVSYSLLHSDVSFESEYLNGTDHRSDCSRVEYPNRLVEFEHVRNRVLDEFIFECLRNLASRINLSFTN